KWLGLLGDGVTDEVQLRPRRHPDAGPDHRFSTRLEMEVEPGAALLGLAPHGPSRATVVEPAGRVRLVRRLVLRKANVAVDANHASFRITANLGRERLETSEHLVHQIAHGLTNVLLVVVTVRLEPLLVVVRGELAEEAEGRLSERHGLAGCLI